MRHDNIESCTRCEHKMLSIHPILKDWVKFVRELHIDAHIAQAFRNKEEQDAAYIQGMSNAKWPDSKHNVLDSAGKPESKAVDLFRLTSTGQAMFETQWYRQIKNESHEKGFNVLWGGDFKLDPDKKLKRDTDHFELLEKEIV